MVNHTHLSFQDNFLKVTASDRTPRLPLSKLITGWWSTPWKIQQIYHPGWTYSQCLNELTHVLGWESRKLIEQEHMKPPTRLGLDITNCFWHLWLPSVGSSSRAVKRHGNRRPISIPQWIFTGQVQTFVNSSEILTGEKTMLPSGLNWLVSSALVVPRVRPTLRHAGASGKTDPGKAIKKLFGDFFLQGKTL